MANPNMSNLALASDSCDTTHRKKPNHSLTLSPSQTNCNSSQGPVAILWDIENCPVPSDVRPEDVAGNIRMALRVHPTIKGAVTVFSAYGDFNSFPRRLREGCQRTGVKLVDVPNGRKDAADKAILVDMFLFALDNPPPSSIMLISGDVDFAPALHILGQRGYTVILAIPSGVGVSSALSNAGRFVWDWPSVVRGEGFVPPGRPLLPPRGGQADVAGLLLGGCEVSDNPDCQNEEVIMNRGITQSYYNLSNFSMISQSLSEYSSGSIALPPCFPAASRSHSLPSGLNEVSVNDEMWLQPRDLNSLKLQLVKLLETSGGCLPMNRLPPEYHKMFGRQLSVSEYGALKLVHLLKKMTDKISVEGKGSKRFVCTRNSKTTATPPPVDVAKNDKKANVGSSDECSDEERVVVEEPDGEKIDENLERFKYELQEILVSYSCRIFLGCFDEIYKQRYKRRLDYRVFGASDLEELLEKVSDVVTLHEEPGSKRKFLSAGGE